MLKKSIAKKSKILDNPSKNLWLKNKTIITPQPGQIIGGRILEKTKNSILVDLGVLGIGKILPKELKESPQTFEELKIGDEIETLILDEENEGEFVDLSLILAKQEIALSELKESFSSKKSIEIKVIGVNKGGLVVNYKETEGFLPLSQLNEKHYPQVQGDQLKIINELRKLMGENLKARILNLNLRERKFIASEKYAP